MRTFNVQLAAIVCTIAIVLGSSFYLVHRYQIRRNAYAFMRQSDRWEEQAEQAAKRKDFKLARHYYVEATKCLKHYTYLCRTIWTRWKSRHAAGRYRTRLWARIVAFTLLERTLARRSGAGEARRRLVELAVVMGVIRTPGYT